MLPQLIVGAAAAALAKKAWDRYNAPKRRLPEDITELVGRPEAVEPQGKKREKKATDKPSA